MEERRKSRGVRKKKMEWKKKEIENKKEREGMRRKQQGKKTKSTDRKGREGKEGKGWKDKGREGKGKAHRYLCIQGVGTQLGVCSKPVERGSVLW